MIATTPLTIEGESCQHITPLDQVQKRILNLMELPEELYSGLISNPELLTGI